MAFIKKNFSPVGGQSKRGMSPQVFSYRTADAAATVDTAGYFSEVRNLLELGDIIIRVTVDDADNPTSVTTAGQHIVVAKSTTSVDVADSNALTVTNTD